MIRLSQQEYYFSDCMQNLFDLKIKYKYRNKFCKTARNILQLTFAFNALYYNWLKLKKKPSMCFAVVAAGSITGIFATQIYEAKIEIYYLELIENEFNTFICKLKSIQNDQLSILIGELMQNLDDFCVQVRDETEKKLFYKFLSKPFSFEKAFQDFIDNLRKTFLQFK